MKVRNLGIPIEDLLRVLDKPEIPREEKIRQIRRSWTDLYKATSHTLHTSTTYLITKSTVPHDVTRLADKHWELIDFRQIIVGRELSGENSA
jgi:HD superfamily phosphohydrolase YqeK